MELVLGGSLVKRLAKSLHSLHNITRISLKRHSQKTHLDATLILSVMYCRKCELETINPSGKHDIFGKGQLLVAKVDSSF